MRSVNLTCASAHPLLNNALLNKGCPALPHPSLLTSQVCSWLRHVLTWLQAAMPTVSSGVAQKLRALLWLCVILGMALGFLSFAIETGGLAATQAHCRQPQFAQYSYVQLPVGLSCGKVRLALLFDSLAPTSSRP